MNGLRITICRRTLLRKALVILLLLICGCREQIVHELSESEANLFITKLHDAAISGEKAKLPNGKWGITVEKSEAIKAIKYLTDARMFKSTTADYPEKTSIISSRDDMRFKFERSLSHELERTLLGMAGVLEARVHLNLPNTDPIFGNRLPNAQGSGSVLIVITPGFAANVGQITELIGGAAGVDKSAINVLVSEEKPIAIMPDVSPPPVIFPEDPFFSLALGVGLLSISAVVILKHRKNKSKKVVYEFARDSF